MGEEPSPPLAYALAWAVGVPLKMVFPALSALADAQPENVHLRDGVLWAIYDLPAWILTIRLNGFAEPLHYDVDEREARRVANALRRECTAKFAAFESNARTIYVSVSDIQSIHVTQERVIFMPGCRYDFGRLTVRDAEVRLHLRGRSAPLIFDGFELNPGELDASFSPLECASVPMETVVSLDDERGDQVHVRVEQLVLAEIPTPELLEEMRPIFDEIEEADYPKLEFEGAVLSRREAKSLLPAMAHAAFTSLVEHNGEAPFVTHSALRLALTDAVEVLRRHGYSIKQGIARTPWNIHHRTRWEPLHSDLILAFEAALNRARQHGEHVYEFSSEEIEIALFSALASLPDHGYRIAPGDLFLDYQPSGGWGGATAPQAEASQ